MDAEALHIAGDHSLLLGFTGADIRFVRAPSNSPSFYSFGLAEIGESERKSEYDHRNRTAVHTFYNKEDKDIILSDSFDSENGVFIRRCISSRTVKFGFSLEKQVLPFVSKPLKTSRGSFPAFCVYIPADTLIDGFDVCGYDRFVFTAFCGDAEYYPESLSGHFGVGESYMIICADSDPNRLAKTALHAITQCSGRLGGDPAIPEVTNHDENDPAEYLDALKSLITKEGFVLSDPVGLRVDPITQYLSVRAFLHAGMTDNALAIIDAYYKRYAENGEILWGERGGRKTLRSACEASVTNALVITAALSLPPGKLGERHYSMLCALMKQQRALIANSMMPFNGNEPEIEAKYLTYHGSALATLLFIESGRELCRHMRRSGSSELESIESVVDDAASHFHGNFIKEGAPLLNCPTRDIAHARPRFKFGYCESCSPRSADPQPCWTEKTVYGVYICPECSRRGAPERHPVFIDPALRRISYTTVLMSAAIGSSLYPRGLIRQIAASLILYPVNEVKSRFDAALLAYIARRYELEGRYVDMADKLLFEKEYPDDAVKTDGSSYFRNTTAASYALMYMTYELPAIPRSEKQKKKHSVNLMLN